MDAVGSRGRLGGVVILGAVHENDTGDDIADQLLLRQPTGRQPLCPRFVGKVGQLSEGDRAIVSASDAGLLLTKAANKIQLLALAQNLTVTLDASAQQITVSCPNASVVVSASGVVASYNQGGVVAEASLTSAMTALP